VEPLLVDDATLLDGVRALTATDPDLLGILERHGPPPLWARKPGFETLVRIILEQQVSLASGQAAYERLAGAVARVSPETLGAIDPSVLESAGLTRQKSRYLRALGSAVTAGALDLRGLAGLDDAAIRATLCAVPGIGTWTADVYLLMALGRPDAWPSADIALATSMARVKRLPARPTPDEMEQLAEPWRPWRAVAARLLWHAYLSTGGSRGSVAGS
jgi:DNA-3-methyladenine glycosylase II